MAGPRRSRVLRTETRTLPEEPMRMNTTKKPVPRLTQAQNYAAENGLTGLAAFQVAGPASERTQSHAQKGRGIARPRG